MKKNELNDMTVSELEVKLKDNLDSLQNFRFQKALQQLEDPSQIRNIKREIAQLNTVLREYEFFDIFPTNISAIDLSYESSDTIEEFTVEFQVQSFSLAGNGQAD